MNEELLEQLGAALPQFKWSVSGGYIWGETQGKRVWWQLMVSSQSSRLTVYDGSYEIQLVDKYSDDLSTANLVGRVVGLVMVARKKVTAWLEELG